MEAGDSLRGCCTCPGEVMTTCPGRGGQQGRWRARPSSAWILKTEQMGLAQGLPVGVRGGKGGCRSRALGDTHERPVLGRLPLRCLLGTQARAGQAGENMGLESREEA